MNTGPIAVEKKIQNMINFMNSSDYEKIRSRVVEGATRAERREFERREDKIRKFVKSMTPMQHQMIDSLAKIKADEKIEEFNAVIDRCISALLIDLFPEKSWDEICKIEDEYCRMCAEDLIKIDNLIKEAKGDNEIMNKNMQKYESEIRAKVNELLEKGLTQKEAIAELVVKFPTLSKSMLTNSYKKLKNEWDKERAVEEDPDVKDALEYIFDEDKKEDKDEAEKVLKESDNVAAEAEKEYTPAVVEVKGKVEAKSACLEAPKEIDGQTIGNKSNALKVVDVKIELCSGDNFYTVTKDKIALDISGDKYEIKSEQDYAEYTKVVMDYHNRLLDEAKQAFETWLTQCKRAM